MLRLALRSLLLSLVLFAIGFASNHAAWFEVLRVIGAFFLTAGIALLLVNYARTPQPPEK
jgi:hypothetical protein